MHRNRITLRRFHVLYRYYRYIYEFIGNIISLRLRVYLYTVYATCVHHYYHYTVDRNHVAPAIAVAHACCTTARKVQLCDEKIFTRSFCVLPGPIHRPHQKKSPPPPPTPPSTLKYIIYSFAF